MILLIFQHAIATTLLLQQFLAGLTLLTYRFSKILSQFYLLNSALLSNSKQRLFIGWRYPPIDWVKVNVDGCRRETQGWLELMESLEMLWENEL
jgi:hypothetical protein